jgi:hypothetical protein
MPIADPDTRCRWYGKARTMTTNTMRLIYYNGTFWRTVQQADGTLTVRPFRQGGQAPTPRATARYYRKPAKPQD